MNNSGATLEETDKAARDSIEANLAREIKDGEYYTISDLADTLGVDRRSVIKWFDMGMIDYFSITRKKTVITETQLQAFLKTRHGDLYRNSKKK